MRLSLHILRLLTLHIALPPALLVHPVLKGLLLDFGELAHPALFLFDFVGVFLFDDFEHLYASVDGVDVGLGLLEEAGGCEGTHFGG
jgi:hypothetical protein